MENPRANKFHFVLSASKRNDSIHLQRKCSPLIFPRSKTKHIKKNLYVDNEIVEQNDGNEEEEDAGGGDGIKIQIIEFPCSNFINVPTQ